MATTNFTSGTVIASDWLNDVDAAIYEGTFPVPLSINNADDPGTIGLTIIQADDANSIVCRKYSTNDNRLAGLALAKAASDTVGEYTAVVDAEYLGAVYFTGADGTNFTQAAQIRGQVDGTVSTGVVPGMLKFLTADSTGTAIPRMSIDSAGQVLIGTGDPTDGMSFAISKTMTGAASAYGIYNFSNIQSDVTTEASGYYSVVSTAAASFTLPKYTHFRAAEGAIGAGSTLTAQYGFVAASNLNGATNNYGFWSALVADGTNDYNFYAQGTAPNYFNGQTTFTSIFGYHSDAGSSVIQNTNKSTGVTINKPTGKITMNSAALADNTTVSFTVNNSIVAADDVIIANIRSGATAGAYMLTVDAVAAGSFRLSLRNESGGSLSEAVVINFAIIKGDS